MAQASIQIVDRSEGLSREEIAGRLSMGWLCVSNISVDTPAIAIPGQPIADSAVDVWMAPPYGAMMPQLAVVQALLVAEDEGADVITLDDLGKMLFQQSLRQIREAVTQMSEEPQEESEAPAG
jgi:hypothetical protein